ncbi:hypothetical protein CLV44_1212 [Marinobacterium halophilum]|uniref:Uncharacterized protein n=1 Tax=Marinobacterium halophilum TaxID=267374 RepID=A0A2P8EQZ2_9GAMM|nr:hypothetical protein [Marinobacterium halophilum]PSL11896.1 hypothetical protein CLV44_1212 [Marinobacterium halophilum]
MGMSKRDFSNDYSKGNLTLLEYPATEFREHIVNNTIYSPNKNINAAAQIATLNMLRRTVQGMKHGDTRPIKLYTVVCEPLSVDGANAATHKQYKFANAVTGAVTATLAFLVTIKLPKSIQYSNAKKGALRLPLAI